MKKYILLALMLLLGLSAVAQQNMTQVITMSATGGQAGMQQNSALTQHTISWVTTGSPTSCTILVEGASTSAFSGPTTIGTSVSCTANGSYTVNQATTATTGFAWVRVNLTVLSGGSSPTVTVTYTGTQNTIPAASYADGYYFIPPGACIINQASGTETVAHILALSGNIPVMTETTTTTTATDTVVCNLNPPNRINGLGKNIIINDATLIYGNSTGITSVCGAPTIATQTAPTAGTSETAAAAALVTAGAVTVTPVVGSCNTAAISAGQTYSEKVALNTPVQISTDLQQVYLTQAFTSPTNNTYVFYVAGVVVHYSVIN